MQWAPSSTVQPKTEAEIRQIDVATGIPLVTSLRRAGWDEGEIEQLQEDTATAQQQQSNFGGALLAAFERGGQA